MIAVGRNVDRAVHVAGIPAGQAGGVDEIERNDISIGEMLAFMRGSRSSKGETVIIRLPAIQIENILHHGLVPRSVAT